MNRDGPAFSVVVPTRDRPRAVTACLGGLAAQDFPPEEVEVIVVDDGGRSSFDARARRAAQELGAAIASQPARGPAAARNAGAERARGRWLAFIDDDCVADSGWLRALAHRFHDDPTAVVGGRAINGLPENPLSSASQLIVEYLYGYYNGVPGDARFLTSNNLALPAEAFGAVGGFDERFPHAAAEDRDLVRRLAAHGRRIVYAPEAVVRHGHTLTLGAFVRQHFRYGRGAALFHRLDSRQLPQLEPLSFYAGLVRRPLREPRAAALATLTVVAQLANVAGFSYETAAQVRRRRRA